MKNRMKLFGIIAIVAVIALSMIGCAKGGTLTIENRTGGLIVGYVGEGTKFENVDESKYREISNGASASWDFDEDGSFFWIWMDLDYGYDYGFVTLEGGDEKVVTAKTASYNYYD